jgi:hypothetical protein
MWEAVSMLNSKTHFDQIPLEAVRRIVTAQLQQEAATDDEIKKGPLDKRFAATEEPSMADLSDFLTEES